MTAHVDQPFTEDSDNHPQQHFATIQERKDIVLYCVKSVTAKAFRMAKLLGPYIEVSDVQAEVAMRVWRAMLRVEYTCLSTTELYRIAYVTAQRWLTQIIRAKLSLRTRSTYTANVDVDDPAVNVTASLLFGQKGLDPEEACLCVEITREEALHLVGTPQHKYLLMALRYGWTKDMPIEDLEPTQMRILDILDCTPRDILYLVGALGRAVKKRLSSENGKRVMIRETIASATGATKVDGLWVQNTEVPRHALNGYY